ncbi:AraC family transcriptional regulator [Pedobacter sp. KBS0701]|uniref:AraC family transcriptional regulator n=1 Tax=Pedobacter sp. KBS0701 TaxID=2578106 RepID=UPI001AEFB12C|nr:AraC family transcriptional regulator [Pedobacter sp. KBS0701]
MSNGLFHSFSARLDTQPNVNSHWHCHNELELVYFKRGNGTQFVGDSVKQFRDGDVVLLGSNLPHYWQFSKKYLDSDSGAAVEIYVVHFNENFWGDVLLGLPEFQEIRRMLEFCKHGLQVLGKQKANLGLLISQLVSSSGSKRISLLIDCLSEISACKEARKLTTMGFQPHLPQASINRLESIYDYTMRNHKRKIDIGKIAGFANLRPKSFCRLFKKASGKTYIQFLNEVRIGQACQLLTEGRLSVKEICYESGFISFTSFHRTFKSLTGTTPLGYQKKD